MMIESVMATGMSERFKLGTGARRDSDWPITQRDVWSEAVKYTPNLGPRMKNTKLNQIGCRPTFIFTLFALLIIIKLKLTQTQIN